MEKKWKWLFSGITYVLVAVLASVLTVVLILVLDVFPTLKQNQSNKLPYLEQLIMDKFIGEKNQEAIEDAAAKAMIEALGDEWSYYISKDAYASYDEGVKNAYIGVGITVTNAEDGTGLLIKEVAAGGSAEEAGILAGDIIVAVDGTRTDEVSLDELSNMIRGEEDTTVEITILRSGAEQTLTVTRKKIVTPVAVGKMLDGKVGLITIKNFNLNCKEQTIEAIEQLRQQGAEKLIFDVRYNPGGYVDELVPVLDYLLPEGTLFQTEDYAGKKDVKTSDAEYLDMPMAVLVNQESYSAAEFFAAALSEYEAAVVVGEQTYGKGYFQSVYKLPDGSAVGLSIGKYYTPEGKNLAGVGITPDVVVPIDQKDADALRAGKLPPEEDLQLQAAIAALSK